MSFTVRTAALAVLVWVIGQSTPTEAGQCGYEYCWGAVGSGPNGAWGWSAGMWSEDDAMIRVDSECGGSCDIIQTFYNTCGAIARASNGAWGWSTGASRGAAENGALGYCRQYGGQDCSVRAWACSY